MNQPKALRGKARRVFDKALVKVRCEGEEVHRHSRYHEEYQIKIAGVKIWLGIYSEFHDYEGRDVNYRDLTIKKVNKVVLRVTDDRNLERYIPGGWERRVLALKPPRVITLKK